MITSPADLAVEVFPPEKRKFKAPLIFLHGLWSDRSCWRPWATHFANLGWDCWAVNLPGRFEKRALEILRTLTFERCVDDLRRLVRESSSAPILLAHSFGGLVALKVAQQQALAALVLLSSVPPREVPMAVTRPLWLLRLKYSPLLWLGRPFRLEDKDLHRSWLAAVDVGCRGDIARRSVPESGRLARAFFGRTVELGDAPALCPVMVVGGGADLVVPIAAQRSLAARLGADFQAYPGRGHWMVEESEGETIVRDVHRWLVQKLGDGMLLADLPGPAPGPEVD